MEDKINIGLFIDTYFPMIDGVIHVVDSYAKKLNKLANITVFAPKPRHKFDDSTLGYKVVRCKRMKVVGLDYDLPMPKFDRQFKKAIKEADLDIIHIHSPFTIGKMAAKYGRKHNIPVVATMHSQFERDFKKATKSKILTKMLLKNVVNVFNLCDELWTMNPACEELTRKYGYKGKVSLIPNGTELENNLTNEEIENFRKEIKEKYSFKDDDKIFISIGRMSKLKNIEFVLRVCKALKDDNFNFKLLLLGTGKDLTYFKNLSSKLKLDDTVYFLGKITDTVEKSKLIAISDLHIFPSFYDTDGIVKIEAAAFKVPTIFIKGSIASSVITDEQNGYIGEDNITKFAEKIENIFKNQEKLEKIKENCKKELYLTWDDITEKVLQNYKKIIGEKND